MSENRLTEIQRGLLRQIVDWDKNGVLRDTIMVLGTRDGGVDVYIDGHHEDTQEILPDVTESDFYFLADEGLLGRRYNSNGRPLYYLIQPTIDAVESNLSENIEINAEEIAVSDERRRSVFVIHGRNKIARSSMFDFLRAIDLHPLEWSEARKRTGKPTPYVGDILDVAFSDAQAFVVIMTPDEFAYLREEFRDKTDRPEILQPSPQSRPNVLFEAGMAMGRDTERTILVEIGEHRPFSDIGGRHVLRMNNSPARRKELASRLETAGCLTNTDGEDWLTVGNFDPEEISPISPQSPRAVPDQNADFEGPKKVLITLMGVTGQAMSLPKLCLELQEPEVRVHFYLDELNKRHYVNKRGTSHAAKYSLTADGRKYLNDEGLL